MRLYYLTGKFDGEYVAGYEIAGSRREAERLTRWRLFGSLAKGRPRRGTPTLTIDSIERAS